MSDDQRTDPGQPEAPHDASPTRRRRATPVNDGPAERRAVRGAARRRRMRTRLWLVTGPMVVVIAVVVVVLVLFGGPDDGVPSSTTSTTAAAAKAEGALMAIEDGGAVKAAVVFQARSSGGVVLVVPGLALLHDGDRFLTVAQIGASGDDTALASALGAVFGAKAQAAASVSWQDLRAGLSGVGISTAPFSLESQEEVQQLGAALRQLTSAGTTLTGVWQGIDLGGDSSGFRSALDAAAGSGTSWTVVAVAGRLVEGDGYSYIEPDVAVARALLTGSAEDSGITVELRNGSGAVGVVEAAALQLRPLGYQITPAGNADDFPNVTETRVTFSAGAADAATRVQALLGVGPVMIDDTVGPGQVVVVLGSDYAPPAPGTVATD